MVTVKQTDSPKHPLRAVLITLTANIIFSPFCATQILRITQPKPPIFFGDGESVCCEPNNTASIEAVILIVAGIMLAGYLGYAAGGVKTNKLGNFMTFFFISACFVLIVIVLPLRMSMY